MPLQVSRIMLHAVVLPTRKLKDCDCCESPDAKYQYLNVIASRSAGTIACQLLQGFFITYGATSCNKFSNCSELIRRNLKNNLRIGNLLKKFYD